MDNLSKVLRKIRPEAEYSLHNGEIYQWIKDDVNGLGQPTQQEIDDALLLVEKDDQIAELYKTMVDEIYTEMKNVFGTRNDASAAAFASTWEAMLQRPANYVDTELNLADEAAVTAYAEGKLAQADAYALYRLKRIEKFNADKLAVINS